ncbi:MAG: Ycf66 family protein [Microcystaceae cyanobacterium]
MVNFGFSSATLLGIFLAVAGAGLYFLRTIRPEVSRDYDIFFSAVGLLAGLILIFQGWRLDPILQFLQLLLSGSTIFFAGEAIRLRGITTEQARRGSPIADDRRVSKTRVYTEAELDQIEPYEEEENYSTNKRRLRGYAEARPSRGEGSEGEEPRRNRRPNPPNDREESRPSRNRRPNSPPDREESRPSRNRRPAPRPESAYTDWEEDVWEEPMPSRRPRRPRPEDDIPESRERSPRRPRPETPAKPQYEDEAPAAYVDYQPLDEEDFPPARSPNLNPRNDEDSPETGERGQGDRVEDTDKSRFDY